MNIYIFKTKHFLISFNYQLYFLLNIIFKSYNQLYNMQYPKVWNMASGVHLRYMVNERGVYPQLTLNGFIVLKIYLYEA